MRLLRAVCASRHQTGVLTRPVNGMNTAGRAHASVAFIEAPGGAARREERRFVHHGRCRPRRVRQGAALLCRNWHHQHACLPARTAIEVTQLAPGLPKLSDRNVKPRPDGRDRALSPIVGPGLWPWCTHCRGDVRHHRPLPFGNGRDARSRVRSCTGGGSARPLARVRVATGRGVFVATLADRPLSISTLRFPPVSRVHSSGSTSAARVAAVTSKGRLAQTRGHACVLHGSRRFPAWRHVSTAIVGVDEIGPPLAVAYRKYLLLAGAAITKTHERDDAQPERPLQASQLSDPA